MSVSFRLNLFEGLASPVSGPRPSEICYIRQPRVKPRMLRTRARRVISRKTNGYISVQAWLSNKSHGYPECSQRKSSPCMRAKETEIDARVCYKLVHACVRTTAILSFLSLNLSLSLSFSCLLLLLSFMACAYSLMLHAATAAVENASWFHVQARWKKRREREEKNMYIGESVERGEKE